MCFCGGGFLEGRIFTFVVVIVVFLAYRFRFGLELVFRFCLLGERILRMVFNRGISFRDWG